MNQTLRAITKIITNLFVLWVALAAGLAFFWPEGFRWLAPYMNLGLGAVMFGMGVTLTSSDFKRVIKTPYAGTTASPAFCIPTSRAKGWSIVRRVRVRPCRDR